MLPKTEARIKRQAEERALAKRKERASYIKVLSLHKKMLAYLNILQGENLKQEAIMASVKAKQKPKKKK